MINTVAIPLIIDIGKCLGLKFVSAHDIVREPSISSGGVLVKKEDLDQGLVENILEGLGVAQEAGAVKPSCTNSVNPQCFSEYTKRWYNNCEGVDSICFGGRWYSRQDPLILNNCRL